MSDFIAKYEGTGYAVTTLAFFLSPFACACLLKQAWENGKVLCGVSAGAICWLGAGHSD
ncbi:Type 1 glutamine amidotransferase-like domain-containing protein [Pseudomonas sp. O64]|uniref:Type 1 glutamine amidotransferase-like domain-containing protein n=1 Tax=Pseudomonas TaxID=286 RepID=UPI0015962B6D|nr:MULTISPECIES: Type 1 glutamine amidotransferase-like domain-containing protein [unclassified Pseudomonas]MCV2226499.1 Type 1 glutamine amidotransferase-like domain-containing protein [Pseudomonas sp. AU10]UXZ20574.1 Type 1 glutamine amidotransferase-like domain-containing protein [Pseudomonas sp. YeP6b]